MYQVFKWEMVISLNIVRTPGFPRKEDDYFGLQLQEFDDCVTLTRDVQQEL